MELRLSAGGSTRTVAITMRTPGADFELAAGFLYGEGIVTTPEALSGIRYCTEVRSSEQHYNVVTVELSTPELPELRGLERHFYTSSACGVCGKASLESLELQGYMSLPEGPTVTATTLSQLPDTLQSAQGLFQETGGLHAAALFTTSGELLAVREDVGRHNAMDKLIGWALLDGRLPLTEHIVMVSGRASFELVQKALGAKLPIFCAVSAPSSLAEQTASRFNMTLVGFLRGERFNIYTGTSRIKASQLLS